MSYRRLLAVLICLGLAACVETWVTTAPGPIDQPASATPAGDVRPLHTGHFAAEIWARRSSFTAGTPNCAVTMELEKPFVRAAGDLLKARFTDVVLRSETPPAAAGVPRRLISIDLGEPRVSGRCERHTFSGTCHAQASAEVNLVVEKADGRKVAKSISGEGYSEDLWIWSACPVVREQLENATRKLFEDLIAKIDGALTDAVEGS